MSNQDKSIMQVGREVVVSEMGNVRETISDIREHPETFMSKITELLKGIWNTIKSAGLIGMVFEKAKEFITALINGASNTISGASSSSSTRAGEVQPLLPTTASAPSSTAPVLPPQ